MSDQHADHTGELLHPDGERRHSPSSSIERTNLLARGYTPVDASEHTDAEAPTPATKRGKRTETPAPVGLLESAGQDAQ